MCTVDFGAVRGLALGSELVPHAEEAKAKHQADKKKAASSQELRSHAQLKSSTAAPDGNLFGYAQQHPLPGIDCDVAERQAGSSQGESRQGPPCTRAPSRSPLHASCAESSML